MNKEEAILHLKRMLPKGSTVYHVLRTESRSGMSRIIDFYAIRDNRLYYLTEYIAALGLGTRTDKGLRVKGCGMDMGFHIVHNLSMELYCPLKYNHDGAFALDSEWI